MMSVHSHPKLCPSSPTSVTDLSQLLDACLENSLPRPALHVETLAEAASILRLNDLGSYTVPSRGLYPYQWNWDAALTAMGWAALDESRAFEELKALFSAQWEDGMVPHIVFHRACHTYFPGPEIWGTPEAPRGTTGITQPPVAVIAVRHIVENSMRKGRALEEARGLFGNLLRSHRWFYAARDPFNSGSVATLHPWESGMDNSAAWDKAMANVPVDDIPPYTRRDLGHVDASMRPQQAEYDRYLTLLYRFRELNYDPNQLYHVSPFRVTDLCTNSVLQRANYDLRWLAEELGFLESIPEIDNWLEKGHAAFEKLWDSSAGIFRSWDQITDQPLDAATSAGFLPLFARAATTEQAEKLVETLEKWMDNVNFGVPSLDPEEARFEPLRYWRGPVWVIVNYMIVDGLRHYGYDSLAERIETDTCDLVNTRGIHEYYDPITGAGAGGSHFSWTAAMCLAWLDKIPANSA